MKDLVGVCVANSAEKPRIGERSLESVILTGESRRKLIPIDFERLGATSVELGKRSLSSHQRNRRASLCAGLGENQGAIVEIKCGECHPAGDPGARLEPPEASSDHEMDHDPQITIDSYRDALSNPARLAHSSAFDFLDWRVH